MHTCRMNTMFLNMVIYGITLVGDMPAASPQPRMHAGRIVGRVDDMNIYPRVRSTMVIITIGLM